MFDLVTPKEKTMFHRTVWYKVSRRRWLRIVGLTMIELIMVTLLASPFLHTTAVYAEQGEFESNSQNVSSAHFGPRNDVFAVDGTSGLAIPALQSSTTLSVSIVSSPWATLDSNSPATGPRAFVVEAVVTNTGSTTATDVGATLDYDDTGDWIPVSGEDLERTIDSLGPGESYSAFWFAAYPATVDVSHSYTVTAQAANASLVATSENVFENPDGDTAKTQGTLSTGNTGAAATTVDVRVGVAFTLTVSYQLGNNPVALALAPAGNLDFKPGSFRLLSPTVRIYNDAETQETTVADQLYFSSLPSFADNVDVTYTFIALTTDSTTLCPYAAIDFGSTKKYDKDYCKDDKQVVIPTTTFSLTKQVSSTTIQQNQLLTYTINYTNTGDQPLQYMWIWDDVLTDVASIITSSITPASDANETTDSRVAWDIGTIPKAGDAGSSGTLTFSVLVDGNGQDLADATSLVNDGFIGVNQGSLPQLSAMTDTVTTTVEAPTIAVSKTDGLAITAPADSLTYTLEITNSGSVAATGLVITDVLPDDVTLAGATTPPADSQTGQILVWNSLGPIAASGGTVVITIPVTVNAGVANGTVLTNTAEVEYQNTAGYTFDTQTATDVTTVQSPILNISKSDSSDPVLTGQSLTYTLHYTNSGLAAATNTVITDVVPPGTTYQSCSGGSGCGASGGVVSWTVGTVAATTSGTVSLVVSVDGNVVSGTLISNDDYGIVSDQTTYVSGTAETTQVFIDINADPDGDGIPTSDEDVDGDGDLTNDDADGDGTPDYLDPDDDGDGVPTANEDSDGDGDGNPATNPDDTDGDGTPDYLDPDDDGDGIPTSQEDVDGDGDPANDDTDGDGTPNYLDPDDDGDGTNTSAEDSDGDGDGNPATNPDDNDGDNIPDYLDPDDDGPGAGDSDGDGVPDDQEDPDGDGDPTNDDTDGDGIPDYLDPDDDGDGIPTSQEDPDGDGDPTNDDSDGDGTPDYLDNDFVIMTGVVGSGSIGANPSQTAYAPGTVVTMTATTNTGWSFTGWSGDLLGSTSPTTITMSSNKQITATFTQNQYTLDIATVGSGWVISNPAKSTYTYGEVVTLTAFANFGWTFAGWSGDLSGLNSSETITITGDTAITATFTQDQYTLTVGTVGSGSVVTVPAKSTYTYGEVITLTATANTGWSFSGWSGDLSGNNNPTTLTMTDNKGVTATFTQNQYTLTVVTVGSGSVATAPTQATYSHGEVVTLTATANTGWSFSGWSGDLSGSDNPETVTMDGNKIITATFTQNQYTLTIITVGSGSVATAPTQAVFTHGEVVTLTATANTGWNFSGWSGDLSGSDNPETLTMDSNKTVTATFESNTATLDFSKMALDVDGGQLLVTDTIRYTLQVTNTSTVTALNVVVTDTMPVSMTLVGISTSQGTTSGSSQIVWDVGDVSPNGSTATMVITATLNSDSANQSIINVASVGAANAANQTVEVCPDGTAPSIGVCNARPLEPSGPGITYGIYLPIIIVNK